MTTDVRHDWGPEELIGDEPASSATGDAVAWAVGRIHIGHAKTRHFQGGGYPLAGYGTDRIPSVRPQRGHQRYVQNSMGDPAERTRLDSPRPAVANGGDYGWSLWGDMVDYRAPAKSGRVLRGKRTTIPVISYAMMIAVIGLCSFWTTAHFLGALEAYERQTISVAK